MRPSSSRAHCRCSVEDSGCAISAADYLPRLDRPHLMPSNAAVHPLMRASLHDALRKLTGRERLGHAAPCIAFRPCSEQDRPCALVVVAALARRWAKASRLMHSLADLRAVSGSLCTCWPAGTVEPHRRGAPDAPQRQRPARRVIRASRQGTCADRPARRARTARLRRHHAEFLPAFRRYHATCARELVRANAKSLRLSTSSRRVPLTSFVRNKLINDVYLRRHRRQPRQADGHGR